MSIRWRENPRRPTDRRPTRYIIDHRFFFFISCLTVQNSIVHCCSKRFVRFKGGLIWKHSFVYEYILDTNLIFIRFFFIIVASHFYLFSFSLMNLINLCLQAMFLIALWFLHNFLLLNNLKQIGFEETFLTETKTYSKNITFVQLLSFMNRVKWNNLQRVDLLFSFLF